MYATLSHSFYIWCLKQYQSIEMNCVLSAIIVIFVVRKTKKWIKLPCQIHVILIFPRWICSFANHQDLPVTWKLTIKTEDSVNMYLSKQYCVKHRRSHWKRQHCTRVVRLACFPIHSIQAVITSAHFHCEFFTIDSLRSVRFFPFFFFFYFKVIFFFFFVVPMVTRTHVIFAHHFTHSAKTRNYVSFITMNFQME